MKDFTITEQDLNLVSAVAGTGKINYKGFEPYTTGAGSSFMTGGNQQNDKLSAIFQNAMLFVIQEKERIIGSIAEFWDYENLPEGINKYDFETLLQEQGELACFKKLGKLYFSPFAQSELNIYNKPTKIKLLIDNDWKNEELPDEQFAIIKNNSAGRTIITLAYRLLNIAEKVLYFLEDNLTASKPKGIVITNGATLQTPNNNATAEAFQSIVNGEDTFYQLNLSDIARQNLLIGDKQLFVPIELADRSESLIKQYNWIFEVLKERFGLGVNLKSDKKERLVTGEIDSQQKFNNASILHFFNVRKLGIEEINKKFNTNLAIVKVDEMWENQMQREDREVGGTENDEEKI